MRLSPLVAALVLPALLSGSAHAELQTPGSVLVFPLADARATTTSILTLTNVRPSGNVALYVEVAFHVDCLETNRMYSLASGDTLSVPMFHAFPASGQGFVRAHALDAMYRPVSANHLVGSMLILDGAAGLEFQVPAVSFASPLSDGALTDLDGDGNRDLNGSEYAKVADELLFPRFLGQSSTFVSHLVLVNLTGGAAFTAIANFLIRNDDGDVYSAQYQFRCFARTPLVNVNGVFQNSFLLGTGQNPYESVLGREAGWFWVDGQVAYSTARTISDPALLAVLVEPAIHSSASLPFGRGLQSNGDLYPTSVTGDSDGYSPPIWGGGNSGILTY